MNRTNPHSSIEHWSKTARHKSPFLSQEPQKMERFYKRLTSSPTQIKSGELIIQTAQNILSYTKAFGENSLIAKRYFATFTQNNGQERVQAVQKFLSALEEKSAKLKAEKTTLQQESDKLRAQGQFLDTVKQQKLELLIAREKAVDAASTIVKRNSAAFAAGQNPLTYATIGTLLRQGNDASLQAVPLQGKNPFVEQILIDWSNEKIYLNLYPDVAALRETLDQSNKESFLRDQIDQLIYNEIAFASRQSGERSPPSRIDLRSRSAHSITARAFSLCASVQSPIATAGN